MESPPPEGSVKPLCRMLDQDDLPEIIHLMEEIRPHIAGLCSRSIYTAICRQALVDERLVITVAEDRGKLIGFTINIIEQNRFWISFLTKRPLLASRIAFRKFLNLMGLGVSARKLEPAELEIINKYVSPGSSGRSWKDSSPTIAKAIFIGVAEQYRGSKIVGKALLNYRKKVLLERGVKRADGIILMHRIASIKLLHKQGGRIERTGKGDRLFVSVDLDQ